MWPNPQEAEDLIHLLKKSLMENFIFCAALWNANFIFPGMHVFFNVINQKFANESYGNFSLYNAISNADSPFNSPFRVRTKVVSRIISKLRNYNTFYCCHGWTVNEKGDECTQRNSFLFHLSPMIHKGRSMSRQLTHRSSLKPK